tara:strand:+ start:560 stop:823 length:264 start_codon:yes stop_codon:yes gene_type:complete
MAKHIIRTVEIFKKEWVIEAYTAEEARDRHYDTRPTKVEKLGEMLFSEECINEFEFEQLWKALDPDLGPDQLKDSNLDWVDQAAGKR